MAEPPVEIEEAEIEAANEEVERQEVLATRRHARERWARVLLLGALLGALIVGNTWDVPLYALLAMGAIVLSQPLAPRGEGSKAPFVTLVFGHLRSSAPMAAAMLGVAMALAVPYLSRFKPAVQGVQFELWIPPAGSWALFWAGIVGLALVSQSGADRADEPRRRMWQVLALCGTIALFAPNVFYIKGFFGDGPNRHQDTVFKFGLQAWLLLGVAGTCGAWWLLDSTKANARRKYFGAWALAWAIPLICTLTVVAFRTGAQRSALAPTLDGASYLPAEDARAVAWLSANARPGSRVLEATRPGGDRYNYVEYGHISALAGVPAPVGWTWHAVYWGADFGRDVQPRLDAIQNIWNTNDVGSARAGLRALGITHVFIGALERRTYPPASIEALKQTGRVAFQEGETVIVEVAR